MGVTRCGRGPDIRRVRHGRVGIGWRAFGKMAPMVRRDPTSVSSPRGNPFLFALLFLLSSSRVFRIPFSFFSFFKNLYRLKLVSKTREGNKEKARDRRGEERRGSRKEKNENEVAQEVEKKKKKKRGGGSATILGLEPRAEVRKKERREERRKEMKRRRGGEGSVHVRDTRRGQQVLCHRARFLPWLLQVFLLPKL